MSRSFRRLLIWVLSFLLATPAFARQQGAAPPSDTRKTYEVHLDFVVRDKKNQPLRDLRPDEVEVLEDGVPQAIKSLILIETEAPPQATAGAGGNVVIADEPTAGAVTIVFDYLDEKHIRAARDAALDFVAHSLGANTFVRVMAINNGLQIIEPFTKDRERVRLAIIKITDRAGQDFAALSDDVRRQVEAFLKAAGNAAVPPGKSAGGQLPAPYAGAGADSPRQLDVRLARATLDALALSEKARADGRATTSLFSLLHIARAQGRVPGRKSVLYFAQGMQLGPKHQDLLQTTVAEANLAGVTFYPVDARGLTEATEVMQNRFSSSNIATLTRTPTVSPVRRNSPESFRTFEVNENETNLRRQGPLFYLAESTGGLAVAERNQLSSSLKRIGAEQRSYYLLKYAATVREHNNSFRDVTVRVKRPGAQVQARKGYAAQAATENSPSLAYEMPLLATLNTAAARRDFPLRAAVLHFEARRAEVHHVLLLETPLAGFIGPEDPAKHTHPADFSVLALVKDAQDNVVQKFSETYPLEIPAAQAAEAAKSAVTFERDFWLPAGSYTLEAVAQDRRTGRASVARTPFMVGAAEGRLRVSNLSLVKYVADVEGKGVPDAPLQVNSKRVFLDLRDTLSATEQKEVSFHLAVFPDAQTPAAPTLTLELLHAGRLVATTRPALPAPDERGRITFTAAIPVAGLPSGDYRMRAVVRQGQLSAAETLAFTLVDGPSAAASNGGGKAAEEKPALPAVTVQDRVGELTLTALDAAKPFVTSIPALLREVEDKGVEMGRRLGNYTYTLRKVRRTLDPAGRARDVDYRDYEAYPVHGQHALVQLSANGTRLTADMLAVERKQATEQLIKNEEGQQKQMGEGGPRYGYWRAGLAGKVSPTKYAALTIDPVLFLRRAEFTAPRTVLLDGRETIVLDFRPAPDKLAAGEEAYVGRLRGQVWIDVAERALVRLEGRSLTASEGENTLPNLVYQQQRLADGVWSPSLIRLNAAGDETLFNGLNWDAWFEFSGFKRFDARDSDLKLQAPDRPHGER